MFPVRLRCALFQKPHAADASFLHHERRERGLPKPGSLALRRVARISRPSAHANGDKDVSPLRSNGAADRVVDAALELLLARVRSASGFLLAKATHSQKPPK